MANVKVRWVLPTTRESGKPLGVQDIKHVRLEVSANDGLDYALIGNFLPSVLETEVSDVDFGTWLFRGTVVDQKNRESAPLVGTFVNEDTTAPGALVELTAAAI